MPTYRTNIELHQAAKEDYSLLDRELKLQHFFPERRPEVFVTEENKNSFLRTRYFREGNLALQDVVNEIKTAANKTGKRFSFTVLRNKN